MDIINLTLDTANAKYNADKETAIVDKIQKAGGVLHTSSDVDFNIFRFKCGWYCKFRTTRTRNGKRRAISFYIR